MSINLLNQPLRGKRIADLQIVRNQLKHPKAADFYSHLRVQLPSGKEVHLLLTDAELKRAARRADLNPEDCPKVGWLRDVFD